MNGVGVGTLVAFDPRTGSGLLWDSERERCVLLTLETPESDDVFRVFGRLGERVDFEYFDFTRSTRRVFARALLPSKEAEILPSQLSCIRTDQIPDFSVTAWITEGGRQASRTKAFFERMEKQNLRLEMTAADYCLENADFLDDTPAVYSVIALRNPWFLELPSIRAFEALSGLLSNFTDFADELGLSIGQREESRDFDIRLYSAMGSARLNAPEMFDRDDNAFARAMKVLSPEAFGFTVIPSSIIIENRNPERTMQIHQFIWTILRRPDQRSASV